jgi:glycosyltransferase involved in cell wall biosynthesis
LNIKITGSTEINDGYGYITHSLALALHRLGHSVSVNPVSIWKSKTRLDDEFESLINATVKPDYELIIMYPTYEFQGIHKDAAIMTMYEAHRCPDVWTKRLNSLKLPIIAPSQFVADMFKNSGVTVPIKVLTLGIGEEIYYKKLRVFPKDRPFRFLTIGKMEPRKNIECLVRCFKEAFPHDEKVELIIKTRERFLPSSVRVAAQKDQRIKIIEKTISEGDLRNLYYYCDAFVYPSRGEGFAFPPRNAIATGMPTLVTDWSALSEIPGAIKVATDDMSSMPSCGFSYGQEKELFMANVDELDLVFQMQDLALDKECYEKKAKETYETTQDSWKTCAKNLIEMVRK